MPVRLIHNVEGSGTSLIALKLGASNAATAPPGASSKARCPKVNTSGMSESNTTESNGSSTDVDVVGIGFRVLTRIDQMNASGVPPLSTFG